MATWVCATCGPVPAGAIRHLDHNSPHGHERHECGSSAGLDWTKKEHEMTTTELDEAERRIIHQTREQAIADVGIDRYNELITVFAEAHKDDPGTIGNPLVITEPHCRAEYRPGHRDGWCGFPPGHPPLPHHGTYYQHGNEETGWWWNTHLPAHCGKPDSHEPHVTDLGKWCDGQTAS